jgi:hypothetical protein
MPFPSASQIIPISVDGGINPRWRQDGKKEELLFLKQNDRGMMAVDIKTTASTIEAGPPTRLFQYPLGNINYGMTPDAQRFLWSVVPETLGQSPTEDTPLTVVLNWVAALKH